MTDVEFTIIAHVRLDGSVPFEDAMFEFGATSADLLAAVEAGLVRLRFGDNHGMPLTAFMENNLLEFKLIIYGCKDAYCSVINLSNEFQRDLDITLISPSTYIFLIS